MVREMVRWCKEGPLHAEVENVDSEFETPRGEFEGFEVR
jgi:acylphosphatase